MARKSLAERSAPTLPGKRPNPPLDLTPEQTTIWHAIVKDEAPDYFRTAALQHILADMCRHKATGVMIDQQIATLPKKIMLHPQFGKVLERMLKMRDRELRAYADKATKLRLTNQSRYTPQAASTAVKRVGPQPWDFE